MTAFPTSVHAWVKTLYEKGLYALWAHNGGKAPAGAAFRALANDPPSLTDALRADYSGGLLVLLGTRYTLSPDGQDGYLIALDIDLHYATEADVPAVLSQWEKAKGVVYVEHGSGPGRYHVYLVVRDRLEGQINLWDSQIIKGPSKGNLLAEVKGYGVTGLRSWPTKPEGKPGYARAWLTDNPVTPAMTGEQVAHAIADLLSTALAKPVYTFRQGEKRETQIQPRPILPLGSADAQRLMDILDSLGAQLRVSSTGWWNGRCPFHEDRTPSFGINPTENKWRCQAASCWTNYPGPDTPSHTLRGLWWGLQHEGLTTEALPRDFSARDAAPWWVSDPQDADNPENDALLVSLDVKGDSLRTGEVRGITLSDTSDKENPAGERVFPTRGDARAWHDAAEIYFYLEKQDAHPLIIRLAMRNKQDPRHIVVHTVLSKSWKNPWNVQYMRQQLWMWYQTVFCWWEADGGRFWYKDVPLTYCAADEDTAHRELLTVMNDVRRRKGKGVWFAHIPEAAVSGKYTDEAPPGARAYIRVFSTVEALGCMPCGNRATTLLLEAMTTLQIPQRFGYGRIAKAHGGFAEWKLPHAESGEWESVGYDREPGRFAQENDIRDANREGVKAWAADMDEVAGRAPGVITETTHLRIPKSVPEEYVEYIGLFILHERLLYHLLPKIFARYQELQKSYAHVRIYDYLRPHLARGDQSAAA